MGIEAAFDQFGAALEAAVVAGDVPAVQALLARPEISAMMGDEQKAHIVGLCRAPVPARKSAMQGFRQALEGGKEAAIAKASAEILPKIKAKTEELKKTVADTVVNGIRASFAQAIHKVWIVSIVVMSLLFATTLLIPNIPLRTKNE
jgi:hypothetical protein